VSQIEDGFAVPLKGVDKAVLEKVSLFLGFCLWVLGWMEEGRLLLQSLARSLCLCVFWERAGPVPACLPQSLLCDASLTHSITSRQTTQ
jgi:hypothetical protein